MRGLGILILIVVFFWLIWPAVSRWLKRKAMERAEDYMRSSMGMPPRDKKKRKSDNSQERYENYYQGSGQNKYRNSQQREPLIPKEYAEDVEFTETKDYSASEERRTTGEKLESYHESQISDAEWTEVKKSGIK